MALCACSGLAVGFGLGLDGPLVPAHLALLHYISPISALYLPYISLLSPVVPARLALLRRLLRRLLLLALPGWGWG